MSSFGEIVRHLLRNNFDLFNEEALDRLHGPTVFRSLLDFLTKFLYITGMEVFKPDYRWNWRTTCTATVAVLYYIFVSYTIYIHWGRWFEIMECVMMISMASQGIVKMIHALYNKYYFQEFIPSLADLYERYAHHRENNRALVFCSKLVLYLFRYYLVLFSSISFAYFTGPIFLAVRYGEYILLARCYIPGLDPKSSVGFYVTTLYHVSCFSIATAGILAADVTFMIIVIHAIGMVRVLKNTLNELDEMLLKENPYQEGVIRKLKLIFKIHQEFIEYEENFDAAYKVMLFAQITSSVFSLVLSLFVFYMTRKYYNALICMVAMFQLLEYCLLGTILTVMNERVRLAIFNTLWYKLPTSQQKMIGFMLHRTQNAIELTVGGLADLNMNTFVEIIKTVYSYSAMLIQFLE